MPGYRMFADDWRARQVERWGKWRWKGAFGLISAVGFGLLVWGFSLTRNMPTAFFTPLEWGKPASFLLMIPVFPLLVAAYVPGNSLKHALGHPMLIAVILWASSHLLTNGRVSDIVLFGVMLAWAVADYASARRRDRRAGVSPVHGKRGNDAIVLAAGLSVWWLFTNIFHQMLIGAPVSF